jgi:hypothetical protein
MRAKNFKEDIIKIECSRASVRRFIKEVLAINQTDYWFHQTLTIKYNICNDSEVRGYLLKLLDSLRKTYPQMPAIYVEERQKNKTLHFHVIFMLFGEQSLSPEETRLKLASKILRRWKKVSAGKVDPRGNWLTIRPQGLPALWYLLKGIEPTSGKLERKKLWHGVRLENIIKANSRTDVSKKEIRDAWEHVFPKRGVEIAPREPRHYFTENSLAYMKAKVDMDGIWDWATFKKIEMGGKSTEKRVSDEDFINFLNKEGRQEKAQMKKFKFRDGEQPL